MNEEQVYREAGLIPSGYNSDGEREWIGTRKQWENAERRLELSQMSNDHDNGNF